MNATSHDRNAIDEPPRLRILLVEDDPATAQSLAQFLVLNGCEVRIATDGTTALQSARDQPPDVALLDIGLPGLDGYQLAKQLREHSVGKRPLLVAVTGHGSVEDRQRSEEAGIDLHLVKPVEVEPLYILLRRFWTLVAPPEVAPSGGAA